MARKSDQTCEWTWPKPKPPVAGNGQARNGRPDEALSPFTKESCDGPFNAGLPEQCRLHVQSAGNAGERRVASSRCLLTVNAALAAPCGLESKLLGTPWLNVPAALPGMPVSRLRHRIIASHRDLNRVKFRIIHEPERKLPAALHAREWRLADGGRGKRHRSAAGIGRWVPLILLALHAALPVVPAWNSLPDRPA